MNVVCASARAVFCYSGRTEPGVDDMDPQTAWFQVKCGGNPIVRCFKFDHTSKSVDESVESYDAQLSRMHIGTMRLRGDKR